MRAISSGERFTVLGVERGVAARAASRAGRAARPGGRACGGPSPPRWRPARPAAAPRRARAVAAGVAAAGTGSSAVTAAPPSAPSTRPVSTPERAEHRRRRSRPRPGAARRSRLQERARLRALDHAVVVGRGHRHDLGHAQLLQPVGVGLGEPGGQPDRAGGDDRALARHQPRHRGHGADAARVGQRDVARPRRRRAAACCRARPPPARRRRRRSSLKSISEASLITGTTSEREPSLRSHVHRQAEAHGAGRHAVGLAVHLGEGVRHHRHVVGGLDDRPGDQVGEGELLAGGLELRAVRGQRRRPAGCGSWWRWGSSGSRP